MAFPHRSTVKAFRFTDCFFDEKTMTAHLCYAVDDKIEFEETITFNDAPELADDSRREALNACLRLLHLAAGVSYYKAYVPSEIIVENTKLTPAEASFFNMFYQSGLGEFSFRNNVSPHISFPSDKDAVSPKTKIALKKQVIVPVGGGKDSVVTVETLKNTGFSPILFSVSLPRAIRETIELSGCPSINVTRKISSNLLELNKHTEELDTLNGHVPITGIIAFILAMSAVIYDFSDVAMSNERSANVGNCWKDGMAVNHQWSKSIEFEEAFGELFKDIMPDFHYFSMLRPLSELAITLLFSEIKKYDSVFTSCNAAFRLDASKRLDRWCADCDKCRFVFLALAPFMNRDNLISIFGRNPLDDENQIKGYEELLGLEAFKPFECVGEIEESAIAFLMLAENKEWRSDKVITVLRNKVEAKFAENRKFLFEETFKLSDNHLIPKGFKDAVITYFEKQICDGLGRRR